MLVLALTLGPSGCGELPPEPLSTGTSPFIGYMPLQFADELGFLGHRATARLVEFSSPTQNLRALRNGSIQAATLTLDEALLVAEDLPDVRIVLVVDTSNGADAVVARSGIGTLADLHGRRIGYEATALGAYMLSRALAKSGLAPTDVTAVPMQVDHHERAFRQGEVDAVVTFEPTRTRLLAAGARELFSSKDLPEEIFDVLLVRGGALQTQREAVHVLLKGWFEALRYLRERPADAYALTGERLGLSVEQAQAAFGLISFPDLDTNLHLLAGDSAALRESIDRLGSVMLESGLLQRRVDSSILLDDGPLTELAR